MALYEHVFLARQDISGQQAEALAEQFKGVIEANGGKVAKVESWGLRNTAYRINKNRKAHYVLMNIDAESAAVNEMERQMRLHDDVLRYMTIRVEEHEEGPSAIMRKSDRDERGDRGDRPDRGDRGDRGPRRDRDDRPPRRFESAARSDEDKE
jgi:small subunit ribosomal protein S6